MQFMSISAVSCPLIFWPDFSLILSLHVVTHAGSAWNISQWAEFDICLKQQLVPGREKHLLKLTRVWRTNFIKQRYIPHYLWWN